jgi:hypothetical protein
VDLVFDGLRFVLILSGATAMAIGLPLVFPTADICHRGMVLMGLLATAGGLALVAFSEGFVENTAGLLMLVAGGLSATLGLIRLTLHELLYGDEKEREGQKEGG